MIASIIRSFLLAAALGLLPATLGAAPVKIIFDTDMCTDCDDAAALGILHVLADKGECEILGTVVSSPNPGCAPAVAAINAYYRRPDLPVGGPRGEGANMEKSRYASQIGQEFPTAVKSTEETPDAVKVYRDILTAQPDGSVVIVTVGYLTNLRHLLDSPGGPDLIRQKVKLYVCMGGNFIGDPPKDDVKLGNVNFTRDAKAAYRVIRDWPGKIQFAGREVCSVPSGVEVGQCLVDAAKDSPVRRTYELYFGGKFKSRHVADLAAVLLAVRGINTCWHMSPPGRMDLKEDMTFEWKGGADGNQSYLIKIRDAAGKPNDEHVEAVLTELLMQPRRE